MTFKVRIIDLNHLINDERVNAVHREDQERYVFNGGNF